MMVIEVFVPECTQTFFCWQLFLAEPFKRIFVFVWENSFPQEQLFFVFVPFLSSFERLGSLSITRKSILLSKKFTLSINLRFPNENEMYLSVSFGMYFILPCLTVDIVCIIKCPSQFFKLR